MKQGPLSNPARERLLDVAITHFARHGLEGATTRAIAAAATTPMSSITYHYGGKEGLYLAAAQHIGQRISALLSPVLAAAEQSCVSGGAAEARMAVLTTLDRFSESLATDGANGWAPFINREQMHPTAAFVILYEGWMGRLAGSLGACLHRLAGGRISQDEARLRAISMIGQALVFRTARAMVCRTMQWETLGEAENASIRQAVRRNAEAILTALEERDRT